MPDSYFRGIPWQRFKEFISPGADRFAILQELLKEARLDYSVLDMAGNRHFYIAPPPEEEYLRQPPSMLVAHYDRVKGSPGANDNSAGVFLLIETATRLKMSGAKNWIVIFTDKEELEPGESIRNQGAYTLALGLRSLEQGTLALPNQALIDRESANRGNAYRGELNRRNANRGKSNRGAAPPRIFSFDACGTGDTLIISTTVEHLLKKEGGGEKLQKSLTGLRQLALDTARNLGMAKVLLAPTPFSDDLGFFRAGCAAQTITMLPSAECTRLVSEIRKNPDFADALISAELRERSPVSFIPETWRSLNSPGDSHLRLTPEHFRTVVRFAEALCR